MARKKTLKAKNDEKKTQMRSHHNPDYLDRVLDKCSANHGKHWNRFVVSGGEVSLHMLTITNLLCNLSC